LIVDALVHIADIRAAASVAKLNPDRVFSKIVMARSQSLTESAAGCDGFDDKPGALAATA